MRSYGLTVARIFIIWDDIERTQGEWNFERYDWIYDAAQESGTKIAATLCSEDPPGWMDLTPFYHNHMNLNGSYLCPRAATYLQKVVSRYRNHPAQGAWLLMNEPHPIHYLDRPAMEAFGKWLQKKYGTAEELNKCWFRPLQTFTRVELSPDQWNSYWVDYPSFIDWHEFNDANRNPSVCEKPDSETRFRSYHAGTKISSGPYRRTFLESGWCRSSPRPGTTSR
jgi:beta-galactosidase GanA